MWLRYRIDDAKDDWTEGMDFICTQKRQRKTGVVQKSVCMGNERRALGEGKDKEKSRSGDPTVDERNRCGSTKTRWR